MVFCSLGDQSVIGFDHTPVSFDKTHTMGLITRIASAVLLIGSTIASPTKRGTSENAPQISDEGPDVRWSEASVGVAPITWRIAIPNVAEGPFDILLQVVAPKTVGWAGIAWGGGMLYNPISLGWANENNTLASGRFAR